eukprot:GHVS01047764.1.p1 GENE.GHVS01047764.1~~GHVS01047764.1.p1  ORF type:complete len:114 (+),score=7.98 GHVS01047764.1:75-416(+)
MTSTRWLLFGKLFLTLLLTVRYIRTTVAVISSNELELLMEWLPIWYKGFYYIDVRSETTPGEPTDVLRTNTDDKKPYRNGDGVVPHGPHVLVTSYFRNGKFDNESVPLSENDC